MSFQFNVGYRNRGPRNERGGGGSAGSALCGGGTDVN